MGTGQGEPVELWPEKSDSAEWNRLEYHGLYLVACGQERGLFPGEQHTHFFFRGLLTDGQYSDSETMTPEEADRQISVL